MYSVVEGKLIIREMQTSDVVPLVRKSSLLFGQQKNTAIKGLRKQISEKNEESDLLFAVLYDGKIVGKIDVIFTDQYIKNPRYKGMKTDGNMEIQIVPVKDREKIEKRAKDIFIRFCKEQGLVDVLGIPNGVDENGLNVWKPMVILRSKKTA